MCVHVALVCVHGKRVCPRVLAGAAVVEADSAQHSLPSRGILGMIAALGRVGRPGRGGGGAARSMPASATVGGAASGLLELLHANMSIVLRTAAVHGGAAEAARGRTESERMMVADVADVSSLRRMVAEAEAEAKVRQQGEGMLLSGHSQELAESIEVAAADVEARQRLEGELGLLLILGLLHFAASESKAVCATLAQPRWLGLLLNIPHYGSPRGVRVCMRLLARVLPAGQPANAIVPPPATALDPAAPW